MGLQISRNSLKYISNGSLNTCCDQKLIIALILRIDLKPSAVNSPKISLQKDEGTLERTKKGYVKKWFWTGANVSKDETPMDVPQCYYETSPAMLRE